MPKPTIQATGQLATALTGIANQIVRQRDAQDIRLDAVRGMTKDEFQLDRSTIPALAISNTDKVVAREFSGDADPGTTTQDFLNRMDSLVEAAQELAISNSIHDSPELNTFLRANIVARFQILKDQFATEIESYEVDSGVYGPNADPSMRVKESLRPSYIKLSDSRRTLDECKRNLEKQPDKESDAYKTAKKAYDEAVTEYRDNRIAYLKKVQNNFKEYAKDTIFPELVKAVPKADNEEASVTHRRIRDMEIKLTTERGRPILFNQYEVSQRTETEPPYKRFDMLIPMGYFTDEQCEQLGLESHTKDTNSCFKRNDEGVSGMIVQAIGYIDADGKCVVDSAFMRHTSPVPIEILDDDAQRAAMTERNANQVADNLANTFLLAEASTRGIPIADVVREYNADPNPIEIPVAEIRLLSVHARQFDNLPGFKDQHQYLQILDTYFAFHAAGSQVTTATIHQANGEDLSVQVRLKPVVMSMGVNAVRGKLISDDLRAWINTRGFNQLSDAFSNQYLAQLKNNDLSTNGQFLRGLIQECIDPSKTSRIPEKAIADRMEKLKLELEISHKDLEKSFGELRKLYSEYEKLSKEHKGDSQWAKLLKSQYEQKTADIMKKIEANHQFEKDLITQREQLYSNRKFRLNRLARRVNEEIQRGETPNSAASKQLLIMAQSYMEIQNLKLDDNYFKAENNYLMQAHLGRMFEKLGYSPASGCNDDKDRGGRYVITRTAMEIFIAREGRVPKHDNETDMKGLHKIIGEIAGTSSSLYHSELTAARGARGFQLFAGDGNEMFRTTNIDYFENSNMAKFGKAIYPSLGHRPVVTETTQMSVTPRDSSESVLQMEELEPEATVAATEPVPEPLTLEQAQKALADFAETNIFAMLMRNEKLAEQLLIKHWDEVKWSDSEPFNQKIRAVYADPNSDRAAGISALRNRYDSVYREGLSNLANKFAANEASISQLFTSKAVENYASKNDTATLHRVVNVKHIQQEMKENPSLLESKNWQQKSYVHGVHLGWKFWGAARSDAVQKIDALIEKYQKTSADNPQRSQVLLELTTAIKGWNDYHQNLHKSSRRAGAIEELHKEVVQELQKIATKPAAPGSPTPPSSSSGPSLSSG